MTDAELAAHIADTAGRLLMALRESGLFAGKALGKAGDRTANAFIMEALAANRPDDAILSEEEVNDAARCAASRVWIVDPLDGTREYGETRTDWAVHVALAVDGVPVLGAVALPGLGLTLRSDQPPVVPANSGALRMLVSRTRPAREAVAVAGRLGADLVPMGSAGAKAMAVVRGEADIYLHTGGQYEWDNCAPAAVALAAGLHCSRIDGSPLTYNHANPYLPDILICRKEQAGDILAAVQLLAEPVAGGGLIDGGGPIRRQESKMALDADELKARACAETGLDAYGDAPLDASLSRFCQALAQEARLSPEGVAKAEALILSRLTERLRIEDFIARHPEVLEQEVAPVLLIAGMPRSGTTAFAQHLSEDPALRPIPRWEANSLVPPETGAHTDADPRLAKSRAAFDAAFRDMPWRQAILPNNFDDPAEHGVLMGLTFLNLQLPTLYRVPSWEAWMMEQDLTPGYEYLARVLKLLQWARPADFWSLKLPPDLFALDAIDRVFPGTKFVWSHRHPLESISSVCSLSASLREKQAGAAVDPLEIGPGQLAFQAEGCDRAMAARATIGENRFVDVYQADLSRDIPGTIEALYARLGLAFTDDYRAKLTARVREKPRGRFGKHEHHLEQYGISDGEVVERFAPYIARFHAGRS